MSICNIYFNNGDNWKIELWKVEKKFFLSYQKPNRKDTFRYFRYYRILHKSFAMSQSAKKSKEELSFVPHKCCWSLKNRILYHDCKRPSVPQLICFAYLYIYRKFFSCRRYSSINQEVIQRICICIFFYKLLFLNLANVRVYALINNGYCATF